MPSLIPSNPEHAPADKRLPVFVVLLSLAAHFVRFGYAYGDGSQDEMLPPAIHLLHSELLTRDWLVQYVAGGINVRTFFVGLLAGGGLFSPLWLSTAILHVLVWCATAYGVYALAFTMTKDRLAAALGMFVVLVVTPAMTLGSDAIIYNAFVPEGIAWALLLPAFALFLKQRWILSGALLGIAAWFQLLAGGLTALVLGLICIWRTAEKASGYGLRSTIRFGIAFIAAALPILIPIAWSQLGSTVAGEEPSTFFIFAVFRNPFHHLFFSIEFGRHVRFWPLMITGCASLWILYRRGLVSHTAEIVRFWIIAFVLWVVSIIFVDLIPIELVAKLQFFKLTVLTGMLAALFVSALIALWLPEGLKRFGKIILFRRWAGLMIALAVILLVLFLAVQDIGRPGEMLYPVRHAETQLAEVERWARETTPVDALFATPPTVGTFRSLARRSVVANWHAFVFDDRAMQTWYERLTAIAPISRPVRGVDPKPDLDAAYHAHDHEQWLELRDRFTIDFLLLRSESNALSFPVAFLNQGWVVYDLRREPENL